MPHALIVDDSKTARYALRQLLDKQEFSVDMVESAEQALEYLQEEQPDLIFMDHMMPGMDGFQAVKAIKSNPATSGIPIVMYTSTQGGVYFGQARALGAADVISKPATAGDLSAVLQRLEEHHLLGAPEPAAAQVPALAVVPMTYAGDEEPPAPPPPAEPRTAQPEPPPQVPAAALPPPRPRLAPWLAVILAAALVWAASAYFSAAHERDRLARQQRAAYQAIEWALNLDQEYPYGEPPFSGERLRRLKELVSQLQATGFRGKIRLESHVGEFCRVQLPGGKGRRATWIEAPEDLALTDCSALGQSAAEAQTQSEGESQAFRRYLDDLPTTAPDIRVETVALGATEPSEDYPTDADISAGTWNRVARHNQRVHIALEPAAAPAGTSM